MEKFIFDLQRFDAVCSLNGANYSSLAAAYAAAQDGDTITLLQDATGNGFEIAKNLTFDLGGCTYTIGSAYMYDARAFTSSTGANYTFKNGTLISAGTAGCINNSGTLTLEDVNIASTTRSYVSPSGNTATTRITGGSSVIARAGNYTLDNGIVITSVGTNASSSPTITTSSDNSATVFLPSYNRYFTAVEGSKEVTYTANTSNGLSVAYDSSGNPSIKNLASGLSFTVATNGSSGSQSVQYNVTDGGLYATADGKTKILQGVSVNPNNPIAMTYLDFDDSSYMVPAFFATNGVLSVSASDLTWLDTGEALKIVDGNDYAKSYGYLTKVDDSIFALTKDSSNTSTLSRIVINDALTAQFSSAFRNIPITAYVSSRIQTSLTSSSSNPFTLSSDANAVVSLQGDVSVSLIGGSIKTANSDVSIKAGNNTVYYTADTGDGVNVIASSGNGTVSGIDVGESFNVGNSSYRRDVAGLRTSNGGVFTSDTASVSANDNSIAIDLASLRGATSSVIQPVNGVLEIGKTHMSNAVIVDSTSDTQVKYAELLVNRSSAAGNAYTLTPAYDGNVESFLDAVDTVSITGGTGTTIYKPLVDGVTIAAGSRSTPDATFKVTEVYGDIFTVNLRSSSAETKISNATGITLLSGTINAARGQTITLGEGGRAFYVTSSSNGMNVTFNNDIATITANAGDTFTVDGKSFTVDSYSDGMTFTVTDDNIIAGNLGTAEGDAFIYNGATYSVRGAGFIKSDSSGSSIWSDLNSYGDYTGNHSLTGTSVTVESLDADETHTWDAVATVRAYDSSATLPPSDTSMKVTLIGNDLKQTYGVFTKNGTACTLETGSGNNEAKLSKIYVTSGVDNFEFGAGLESITINSAVASLMVTEDDGNDGYKVTLIGSATDIKTPAILDGISRVSLISGSLRSDSAFTTNVLDKGIVAGDQSFTLATDSYDASINGLTVGNHFSVEGGDNFIMSGVGLVNENGRYLLGTREGNPIKFSQLDSDTPWGGLIDDDVITITANTPTALIVDDTSNPTALYADYININGTQSLRAADNADAWSDKTIYVSNATVNFDDYFAGKKIQGVRSKAAFTVEDDVAFNVQDALTGAAIGSAANISQTGGTVSLTSGQTIHSRAGSITAGTGDLTFTVNKTAATIGALDNSDVFSLSAGSSGNVEYTRNNVGIVTNDNRILTGLAVREFVTVAQLIGEDNRTNTVQINSAGVLALPPTVSSDLASPWVILSNDKDNVYGTLELTDSGYSIHRSNNAIASFESPWALNNTISLLSADAVTLTKDYSGAWISGLRSGASVSTSDATDDFTVTDGNGGATVSGNGTVKVNQAAGVVVPQVGQTVTAADNYAIAVTSKSGDIKVSVSGSDAIVTNLSKGDTFTINNHSFEVLTGGVIRRDGSELLQGSAAESAATLVEYWLGKLEIDATSNWVMDGDYLRNNMTSNMCYIVDKANNNRVYGMIQRATSNSVTTYTVSADGANVTPFASVTINTNIERVTFAKEHYITNAIPITAGDATFTVTDLNVDSFTVNCDYTTQTANIENATTVNLSSGTIKLTDPAQVVTAGSTTAAVNSGTITVNYDGTSVTVGSMDTAGDSVKINGTYDYTYLSGNGMTIEIAGGVTTFKNLDNDSFMTPDGTTYTINSNGFVKNVNGTNYIWTGSTDVQGDGVTLSDLGNSSNWTQIAVVSDGNLTIDSSSTSTVVLVGNPNNPTATIYGTLKVSGAARTLTADGIKNAELNSITVDGVTVTIGSEYSSVPIIPKGNNPTINTTAAMTFRPEDDGMVFKVVTDGEETEYTYSVNGSNYKLSRGFDGNIMTLTQNNNTYTLPGGRWVTSGGTFTIPNGESVTLEYGTITTTVSCDGGDYITARGAEGEWQEIGALNTGDKFTVGNTSYEMTSAGLYNLTNGQLVTSGFSGDTFTIDEAAYGNIITLDYDGNLDLTRQPSSTYYTAPVVGFDSYGNVDVSKAIATLEYDGASYTLTPGAYVSEMTSVSLNAVKTLTIDVETTVTTPSTGTYTINGYTFTARSALTFATTYGDAILTDGTVNLSAGSSVSTPNNEVSATTGTITVAVSGSSVTISNLSAGKVFEVDGNSYTMTAIGLSDGSRLLSATNSVTVAALNGSDWQNILQATGGALSIDKDTTSAAVVVDVTSPTNAKKYGTLTRSGSAYTYTRNDSNTLSSITLSGVEVTFDRSNAGVPINTDNATFTVNASGNFTVNAISTPELTNVTAITLTSGTIQAPLSVPVTVGTRRITATEGDMTVGLVDNKVIVSELNTGDKFTIGNTSYEMTNAGLYNLTNGQLVTAGLSDDMTTFYIDEAAYGNVITLDTNGNLNLTAAPVAGYTALVVKLDSDGNVDVTKQVANVEYDGTGYTLTAGAYVSEMTSVSLNAVKTLTTDITTTVRTSKSGTYTINGKSFTARNALTIATDSSDATLTDGSVTLKKGNAVTLTTGKTIAATAGTITVTISGDTVTLGAIGSGDAFTVDDNAYTMTASGLSNGKSVRKIDTAITLAELDDWQDTGFVLDDSSEAKVTVPSGIAVVDATARTKAIKITANKVANSIVGGAGKDTISAGNGNDTVYGGSGNDSISGGNDDDYLSGDAGNDKLLGGAGNDTLAGGAGNDSLTGGGGNDVFLYSAGNDVITDMSATDTLQIGDGSDTYSQETVDNNIVLTIGDGSVTLTGAASLETLNILGAEFTPTVKFTNNDAAKVTLNSGVLTADATARTSAIRIVGNALENTILGGSGKDTLYGKDGDDYIEGGKGNDKLYGQNGNDTLWGDVGNDTLDGGAGADVFIYASGDGKDVISGFEDDDMLLITGAFSASVNASAKSIAFKVDSTASAVTIKNYTADTFNINGLKYQISGKNLVMK